MLVGSPQLQNVVADNPTQNPPSYGRRRTRRQEQSENHRRSRGLEALLIAKAYQKSLGVAFAKT
jgi:hypothetical protein